MNWEQLIGLTLAGLVMLTGLGGTFIPGIPGAPLILLAAVGHRLWFGEQSASWMAIVVIGLFMVLSLALDFFASMLGAKKLGATWRGVTGAVLGVIVGVFFSLPGIILGPFIGAFLFEIVGGRDWRESARAGAGAMLGLLLGTLGRVGCCVVMIAIFYLSALTHTTRPGTQLAAHPRAQSSVNEMTFEISAPRGFTLGVF